LDLNHPASPPTRRPSEEPAMADDPPPPFWLSPRPFLEPDWPDDDED
jgi:hypothetical protein